MSDYKINVGDCVVDVLLVESHARGDDDVVEERHQYLLGCADDDCLSQNGEHKPRDRTRDDSENDTTGGAKWRQIVFQIFKVFALVCLLYLFICSLDFLGSAFRLLGGRAAGATLSDSELLQNPIAGLMIGVLATVLLQSSSTSSSIVVTMVASGIMTVQPAIPIIMGANIGTSLTNTIVSLAQSANRDEFRRAFAGATVHDMFNWLTVIILLPLEMATGYLFHLTDAIVSSFNGNSSMSTGGNHDMLQAITKPFTGLIIQLDKAVIEGFATGHPSYANMSLLKEWCSDATETAETAVQNMTSYDDISGNSSLMSVAEQIPVNSTKLCSGSYLFYYFGLGDLGAGGILLVMSLLLLCGSLILMVKILNSALQGKVLKAVKKTVNAELPGHAAYFTGYVAMVIGAVMTMLVQSSSVFTSVLTPLVGVGVVKIERMYPLTLGSNIGTTTTGILAAMAASSDRLRPALQIAFCHLFFNLSGILLFYPIPCLRFPIQLAKLMGKTTAKYRWFAIIYVVAMFFAIPLSVFALSWLGNFVLTLVASVFILLMAVIIAINFLQRRRPTWLPPKLQTWDFLPLCLHSLEPADRAIHKVVSLKLFSCFCSKLCVGSSTSPKDVDVDNLVEMCPPWSEMALDSEMTSEKSNENNANETVVDGTTSLKVTFELANGTVLCDDSESGYGSTTATPAPSRLPSYAQLPILDSDSVACTPAPSRKSSFVWLPIPPIAEVMTSDDETNEESKG